MVEKVAMTLAILLTLGLFSLRALQLLEFLMLGKPENRFDNIGRRVGRDIAVAFGQRKILQWSLPGLMHVMIYWGFLVLFTTIVEAFGAVYSEGFALPVIGRWGPFGAMQDAFVVAVLTGIAIAFYIRLVQKPGRFTGSHKREALYILFAISAIMLTILGLRATEISLGHFPYPRDWAFASNAVAIVAFDGLGPKAQESFNTLFLWWHSLIILGFMVYLGYSKHLHIITSTLNVFFSSTASRPAGALRKLDIDMETMSEDDVLGAAKITDLSWKQLLDTYTCTECGRCQTGCPAWNTGKPLSPKLLIMDLRDHLFEQGPGLLRAKRDAEGPPFLSLLPKPLAKFVKEGPPARLRTKMLALRDSVLGAPTFEDKALNPDVVDDEVIWSCTTCGACVYNCPVDIEHIDAIVDMRRNLVMMESRFPKEMQTALTNLENSGNPWGQSAAARLDWAVDLDIPVLGQDGAAKYEVVYWVGCAGALEDRNKKVVRSFARIMNQAGVSFAILGSAEQCNGDPARRLGQEYLFQTMAVNNIATLDGFGVKRIVTACPHCFNTLRNEYPQFGGHYQVKHHSEFLAELIDEGRLKVREDFAQKVAYHDPCYMARHNQSVKPPRKILREAGAEVVEMHRHSEKTFCCGAGGGRMWLEERTGKKVNIDRADEAIALGVPVVGVGCPFCHVMLDDGVKERGADSVQVRDLAQILESVTIPEGATLLPMASSPSTPR